MLLVQHSCQKIIKVSSCPSLKRARNQNQVILEAQKFSALYKMRCCCCLLLPYLLTASVTATTTIATPSWVWVFTPQNIICVLLSYTILTCGKTIYNRGFIVTADFMKCLIRMLIFETGEISPNRKHNDSSPKRLWVLSDNQTLDILLYTLGHVH